MELFVRASGTCWIFAILAAFGCCDHAFTAQDKRDGKEASLRAPTNNDQDRQREVRDKIADTMTERRASSAAIVNARLCCKYHGSDATSGHDKGGYGTENELKIMCELFKISIVVVNVDTRDNGLNDSALCFIFSPSEGTVSEEVWTPEQIDQCDCLKSGARCVFLAYSAKAEHYNLLKPTETLTLPSHMLVNLGPW
jgi:hypothetical protein